jgi:hypothetical protein
VYITIVSLARGLISPYAHREPYGLFQSVENRLKKRGRIFLNTAPFFNRFVDSFQTVHKAPCVRKVRSNVREGVNRDGFVEDILQPDNKGCFFLYIDVSLYIRE